MTPLDVLKDRRHKQSRKIEICCGQPDKTAGSIDPVVVEREYQIILGMIYDAAANFPESNWDSNALNIRDKTGSGESLAP